MTKLRTAVALLCLCACSPEREAIDLDAYERKGFSQFGEEGVLEKIFEVIPPTARYAVEFGAHNGVNNSNTRNLIAAKGWGSLQIEGDPRRARGLKKLYRNNPKVTAMEAWVFPGNIEILIEAAGVPKDLDLLVIDIDSNDYYVWKAIHNFRPKVVMIESNNVFPPPELAVIDFHPMNYWDQTSYSGASMQSMYELGKRKGYELVHVMNWGPNIIFVDKIYYDRFGIKDNSPVNMWHPLPETTKDQRVFPPGKKKLRIDAFEIEKKWILGR